MKLTQIQSKTLDFVREYIRQHGSPPTLRELGEMRKKSGIGGSNSSVFSTVTQLRIKGLVQFGEGKHRAICPTNPG